MNDSSAERRTSVMFLACAALYIVCVTPCPAVEPLRKSLYYYSSSSSKSCSITSSSGGGGGRSGGDSSDIGRQLACLYLCYPEVTYVC